jgi:two-component system, OmpR family, sensor histidine kinase BaeS
VIRTSLLWKFTLAFLLVAVTAAALVALFIRLTSVNRLNELIIDQQRSVLSTALEDFYAQHGSWDQVEEQWMALQARTRPYGDQLEPDRNLLPKNSNRMPERDRWNMFGLADEQGVVIVPVDARYPKGTVAPGTTLRRGIAVISDGNRVGTILTAQVSPRFNPEENLYLQRTNQAMVYALFGAMAVALVMGILLARTLTRPIKELTSAAQNIAAGQLAQQVKVSSQDEIGQLAGAFNQMSQEVVRVNQQRKQMTADIAHDLRTPLTVIAGYVESMRDGVLLPTAERLGVIYTEIERLQDLVGDLRMLSQADAGELPLNPQPIAPKALLEQAAAPFAYRAAQQGIALTIDASEKLPAMRVDVARMMQVFGNLVSNALRYTPEGGTIRLSASASEKAIFLSVQDNGTGIALEDLPYIFDRFHRADRSRHTEEGESGLGLAIVKALVEAHGGVVSAESTLGQGTRITIKIPYIS